MKSKMIFGSWLWLLLSAGSLVCSGTEHPLHSATSSSESDCKGPDGKTRSSIAVWSACSLQQRHGAGGDRRACAGFPRLAGRGRYHRPGPPSGPSQPDGSTTGWTAVTGTGGHFRIGELAPGTFTATASASAAGSLPAVQAGIELAGGIRTLAWSTEAMGLWRSRPVLDHEGSILPGARVTARATPATEPAGDGPRNVLTTASQKGSWSMTSPGWSVCAGGRVRRLRSWLPVADPGGASARGRCGTCQWHFWPRGPCADRTTRGGCARPSDTDKFARMLVASAVESDIDGRFRLQRLPLGDFLLKGPSRGGWLEGRGPWQLCPHAGLPAWRYRGRRGVCDSRPRPDRPCRPVLGVAVMSAARSDAGIAVVKQWPKGPSQSRAFPPGSHEVQVWLKDGGRARQEVTVKSADVTDVELRITPGLVARGHVDDRQGRPASAVRVIATTDAGREAERYNRITTTDARGDFNAAHPHPLGRSRCAPAARTTGWRSRVPSPRSRVPR